MNTTAIVRSPDGDTKPFPILAGVLQGDTLAAFMFIIALDYILRTSLDHHAEYGFTLEKSRSRRYLARKITINLANNTLPFPRITDIVKERKGMQDTVGAAKTR